LGRLEDCGHLVYALRRVRVDYFLGREGATLSGFCATLESCLTTHVRAQKRSAERAVASSRALEQIAHASARATEKRTRHRARRVLYILAVIPAAVTIRTTGLPLIPALELFCDAVKKSVSTLVVWALVRSSWLGAHIADSAFFWPDKTGRVGLAPLWGIHVASFIVGG